MASKASNSGVTTQAKLDLERERDQRNEEDARLLSMLAELGGSRATAENIRHEGKTLVIPDGWTNERALEYLQDYVKLQEEPTTFEKTFRYRPWDGARAMQSALTKIFGSAGIARGIWTFFGKRPPELIDIHVDFDRTEQVPWGALEAPLFGGVIYTDSKDNKEYGPLFHISVETQRKFKSEVEGLFRAIEDELRANSIYRGKAINGATDPEFLDLRGVDPSKVVYSDEVTTQLEANVWSLIQHTQRMRELEIPLKRAVLFEGDYGTGKTLGAFLTAQKCVENGWSFHFCRPGKDNLNRVLATARLYQPSVVFAEDLDDVASEKDDRSKVARLLDAFDGITAKGTEILCILTTNHPDRIVKGMVRPGRLDSVIHFGGLDTNGVSRMIEAVIPAERRDDSLEYERIGDAMGVGTTRAFTPAFVREAIDRTMRYAMSRGGGDFDRLVTDDFVGAADGLRAHLELMQGAGEGTAPDRLSTALRETVAEAVVGLKIERPDGETFAVLENGGKRETVQ